MNLDPENNLAGAVEIVRKKILLGEGIVDLTRRSKANPRRQIADVLGYIVRIPHHGAIIAIKPEALRERLPGNVRLYDLIGVLDSSGNLIHGCDGKRTRQILIAGIGRHRYYCLKRNFAQPHGHGAPAKAPNYSEATKSAVPTSFTVRGKNHSMLPDWHD